MQDPEMCFVVVDNRTHQTTDLDFVSIHPYMFQQANMGICQQSIQMENNRLTKYNRKMQADHTIFANQWLYNIRQQGFLK